MDELYDRIITEIVEELRQAVDSSSQTQVARQCKTSIATVQRLVKGKRGVNLPLRTVLTICQGLNLNFAEIASPLDDKEKIKTLLSQINKLIANQ